MNKKIFNKAKNKFKELSKKYDGFLNVFFDDWRGPRFVFDSIDVRRCNNDCKNCPLYNLLKKEGINKNSFGLFPATKKDKKLFGPQNFLNCKTTEQYKNCFINFILENAKNDQAIKKELLLIKNLKIIFPTKNSERIEKNFKKSINKKLLTAFLQNKKTAR